MIEKTPKREKLQRVSFAGAQVEGIMGAPLTIVGALF
jgi:hypothetical protein